MAQRGVLPPREGPNPRSGMTMMTASHLVLLLAVLMIIAVLVLLVVALAAVPVAVTVGSVALALGVGYHYLVSTPRGLRRSYKRPSAPRWAAAAPAPFELDGPQWTQVLPALPPPDEIPAIRHRVAEVLADWQVRGEAAEPALVVVTELLTNALEHADAPIRITLERGQGFLRVQVRDGAPEPPRRRPRRPADKRGHGLEILEALTLRRGWTPDPYGKTVWADVPWHWPK